MGGPELLIILLIALIAAAAVLLRQMFVPARADEPMVTRRKYVATVLLLLIFLPGACAGGNATAGQSRTRCWQLVADSTVSGKTADLDAIPDGSRIGAC